MLDTSKINRKLKGYIKTLMTGMIQTNLRDQIQNIVLETFEGNSTTDFIRNVTLHDLSKMTAKEELIKESKQNLAETTVQVDDIYETTVREFHLGFLNSCSKDGYLYLYMVSQSDCVCHIHIPRLSHNSTLKVLSRNFNSYKISPIVFMDQQGT
ncbi:unnamed protein product [Mytilus coruscus]|uniref:Uncharacterized protein n=1 Tax=Mytilus coruscus TaxID=42192 RepID=A0A6J8BSF0_MYTCO|nr:unnamed protein product [Mytilus coruscus]